MGPNVTQQGVPTSWHLLQEGEAKVRLPKGIAGCTACEGPAADGRAQEGASMQCSMQRGEVIFIDEVHALTPAVANILLSALDDARLTTIDHQRGFAAEDADEIDLGGARR